MSDERIVIYDGVCNFCNGAVWFIAKRDPLGRFKFTPMQSDFAQTLIQEHKIQNVGKDTFLLIKHGQSYIWTEAALEIAGELTGGWWLFKATRIIPRPIRDWLYRAFARNRYVLFGRTEHCQIPDSTMLKRFIGLPK
jgi:predicted DCC family thiol-disulfide oxidoreductase YuxK